MLKPHLLCDVLRAQRKSAFHWACMSGALIIVGMLLRHGANIHAPDGSGLQPIHLAAQYGTFALFSQEDSRLNFVFIALSDRLETVALLRARGADVNARDPQGRTPLLCVLELSLDVMADYLIKTGVDVVRRTTIFAFLLRPLF
jgi:ankyrin repeat protein